MSGNQPFKSRNPYIVLNADTASPVSVGLKITTEVGTEAANVIALSLSLADSADEVFPEAWTAEVKLMESTGILCVASAFRLSDGGSGTMVTDTNNARAIFTSDASGDIAVNVSDVAGASGSTIYAMITRLGGYGSSAYTAITFD